MHALNILNTLVELEDTNGVASAFNEYVTQAVDRVCVISKPTGRVKNNGAPWFDKECRQKRAVAIQAGHRVESIGDRQTQIEACRQYRTHTQRNVENTLVIAFGRLLTYISQIDLKYDKQFKNYLDQTVIISAYQTMSFSTISKTCRIFIQKTVLIQITNPLH